MENKKFWTEFIDIYHDHACLWNAKCREYSKKHKRNASYEVLLKKLKEICPHATIEILKKKINNMRTTFRREFKKVIDSKHTGEDTYRPSLWYYDLLLFTADSGYRKGDKSTDKLEDFENSIVDITDETEYKEEYPDTPLTSLTPASNDNSDIPYLTNEYIQTPLATNDSQKRSSTPKLSKYNVNNTEEQNISNLLDLVHKALTKDEDEYQITGKRIAHQLKKITEPQRIIAEKLISDVIYYARIGKLTEDASVYCNSSSQFQP